MVLSSFVKQNILYEIKIEILRDYDEWADLGNAGWGWKDVLPFFIKSEKLHNDQNLDYETHIDQDMHGREGRQHVMPGCKVIVTKLRQILFDLIRIENR